MAKKPSRGIEILGIAGAVMLMIAAWQVLIPLPYLAPRPITLLSLIAVLYGIFLGPRRGTLIVALYVLAVILDLPPMIWRQAPDASPFLGVPTNGLIFGLIFAALAAGALTPQGGQSSAARIGLAAVLGHLAYLAIGIAWLARFTPLGNATSVMVHSQMTAILIKSAAAFSIAMVASRFIKR